MEKKIKKGNVATGASSVLGSVVGVGAMSAITSPANAAEVEPQETDEIIAQPAATQKPHQESRQATAEQSVAESEPIAESAEPEVQVLAYDTITLEDGTQSDMAAVAIEGQVVLVADFDRDGFADGMASDLNGNGMIDEDEIVDVQGQGVLMQPLQDAAPIDIENDLAYNSGPDYINDADVTDYMA